MSRMNRISELDAELGLTEGQEKAPVAETKNVRGQQERDAKTVRTRQRGVFDGTNKKLDVLVSLPGYHLHWFNDDKARLDMAVAGGYEFVSADDGVVLPESTRVMNANSAVDSRIRRIVGSNEHGGALYAYLMKLPNEFREEDLQIRRKRDDERLESLTRNDGAHDGATDLGNRYIPNGRKKAFEIRRGNVR